MFNLTRREFLQLGAASTAALAAGSGLSALAQADELARGGKDFGRKSHKERQGIPSVCLQCVSGCGIIGYVEDGRLVKIEGNPEHPNSRGTICARGQAGVNQVYDPDRILYPMRRVGARGEGKWKRISWEEALNEVAGKMRELRESGKPHEFVFRYGRNRVTDYTDRFFDAYGTPHRLNHTTICEGSKQVALQMTWGKGRELADAAHTKYVLNFGCNPYEAHTQHSSLVQRIVEGRVENGAKLVTFDVRMSNTAGRSDEWFPVKPGTDAAVALAMCNVIMEEQLYDEKFINTWTNVTVEQLKQHLAQFTPEWAEKISGVPAKDIARIAKEFAGNRPRATTLSYRGVCAHYNGTISERCISLLNIIIGSIDQKGGYGVPKGPKFADVKPKPEKVKLHSELAKPKEYPLATHTVSQLGLPLIKEGREKVSIYMTYVNNDAYSYPDNNLMTEILKDEKLIPYFVAVDAYMGEATALADIILPDAIYLERTHLDKDDPYGMVPYIALRQKIVAPLGEAKSFHEYILPELAKRIGGGMEQYYAYGTVEDFMTVQLGKTPELLSEGGLDYLKKHGVWYDKTKKPAYKAHTKEVKPEDLVGTTADENGVITKLDDHGKPVYVGIMIEGKALKGFSPDKHFDTGGKIAVYSKVLEEKGFPALPTYVPIPEHQNLKADELIMTTFKVNVHTQSRTANCKWLSEIYHENSLWMHPEAAAKRGLKDGDLVVVTSKVGSQKIKLRVTEGIYPGVVSFADSVGHSAYGRIASGKQVTDAEDVEDELVWWKDRGAHLNSIIPVTVDPVGGNQGWMDTVVTVKKA
ncbi:MAG: molybdopterin-dependent oxidoreductase [Clostridia bacterium]|nr:molybdopterin-dependent oxidoreductase [Clostridia bacterium]